MLHSHKLSVSHVTLSNALTLPVLPKCCYVLYCTTYSFCLDSWYKHSIGLPTKHLPPLYFSSLFPEHHVLIDNSGGSEIRAWYVLCRSPPFLPLLSKKSWWPLMCPFIHSVISTQDRRECFLMWPKVMVWHLRMCDSMNHAFWETWHPECSLYVWGPWNIFFMLSLKDVLASLHILVSSGGDAQFKNICIKSIQRMLFSYANQYFCFMWCITHHKPPAPVNITSHVKTFSKEWEILMSGFGWFWWNTSHSLTYHLSLRKMRLTLQKFNLEFLESCNFWQC